MWTGVVIEPDIVMIYKCSFAALVLIFKLLGLVPPLLQIQIDPDIVSKLRSHYRVMERDGRDSVG